MINIQGDHIYRAGQKIGEIDGKYIRSDEGKKLGYFEDVYVRDSNGNKLAYIEGNYLYSYGSGHSKIELDDINEQIIGGVIPELGKCAVYVLLGN